MESKDQSKEQKQFFVFYKGKDIEVEKILEALNERNHDSQSFMMKYQGLETRQGERLVLAKIEPKDKISPVYIDPGEPTLSVSGYDDGEEVPQEFSRGDDVYKDFVITKAYQQFAHRLFFRLYPMHFCSVLYDYRKNLIVAGVTEVNQTNNRLYYGYTKQRQELMFSNDYTLLNLFCGKVYKMADHTYMLNGTLYDIDGQKKKPFLEDIPGLLTQHDVIEFIRESVTGVLTEQEEEEVTLLLDHYEQMLDTSSIRHFALVKEDIEKMTGLIQTASSIRHLYQQLKRLDATSLRRDEEYQKYLDYLSIALEVEAREYEEVDLTFSKCVSFIEYLYQMQENVMGEEEKNVGVEQEIRPLINRMVNHFYRKMREEFDSIRDFIPVELQEEIERHCEENHSFDMLRKIEEAIYQTLEVKRIFTQEYLHSFLYFVKKSVEQNENPVKKYLSTVKYEIAFMNQTVENDLMNQEFEIPQKLCCSSRMQTELLGLDYETHQNLHYDYAMDLIEDKIDEISSKPKDSYQDAKGIANVLVSYCFLRAALLTLTREEHRQLFRSVLESEEEMNSEETVEMNRKILENCLQESYEDKSNPDIIVYGKPLKKKIKSVKKNKRS